VVSTLVPICHNPNTDTLPQDLIATISALTLSIRVVGGAIGYTIYFNIFINKFNANAIHYIGGIMSTQLGITNRTYIADAITLTTASLLDEMKAIPGLAGNTTAYDMVVAAGQYAYAESYKYVYLTSIAFGVLAIVASLFLGDITKYMDDHVAVEYY
jgi:Fungal trichothecene efflux pump (TRI12)